ncbi:Hypothetical protein Minf_1658 [Methylacidiphilum infernorum V4]|uniref:Uncharacterized protein n=1 Tax=Methylacidiphilum infernorum (isolate V4) TaxID=481448 RepID=B3DWP9_METI4|nr:Hypothetical protein Minf_1658 [Methylacidiphilum infernorum V4]
MERLSAVTKALASAQERMTTRLIQRAKMQGNPEE